MSAPATPHEATSAAVRVDRSGPVLRWVRGGQISTLAFFVPLLVTYAYFAWWPIISSAILSVQRTNLVTEAQFVGMANFTRVLADPLLAQATANTVWFTVLAVVIGFPVPILLAVAIAELRRTRGIASVLAYIPVVIPPVVSVLLWKAFYNPAPEGIFNTIFGWVGLGPFPWLQDGNSAMPSIVVQATWAGFGQTAIIYLAALMSIQSELYEAAELDGAGVLQRTWNVTLPQIRFVMLFMLLLQMIGTMQVFTEPTVMTGGGPANKTVTLLMLVYRYAFVQGDYGKATALSVMLALVLSVLSALYLAATRKWGN